MTQPQERKKSKRRVTVFGGLILFLCLVLALGLFLLIYGLAHPAPLNPFVITI